MLSVSLSTLQKVAPLTSATRLLALLPCINNSFQKAEITTELRAAMYLAQTCVESDGFTRFEESLNYSAERLMVVWPHRFPSLAVASPYAHSPEKLANLCYADRLGNGDVDSGDGWKHRGVGAIMLTGFADHLRLAKETGIDFAARPELLALPEYAFVASSHFWSWKWLNLESDRGDVPGATKKIQGGTQGLTERAKAFDRACESMGVLHLH